MILNRLVLPIDKLPEGEVKWMLQDLVADREHAYVIAVSVAVRGQWEARIGWPKEFYLIDHTNQEYNYYCRRDEDYDAVAMYGMALPESQARQLFETSLEYYHA
jgi:hypothetical protein